MVPPHGGDRGRAHSQAALVYLISWVILFVFSREKKFFISKEQM
jgi:hypothetical protein